MAFVQLTFWESLRDIEACLRVAKPKLYHIGHSWQSLPEYPCPCQSSTGLAYLRRLRSGSCRHRTTAVRQREFRCGLGAIGVCAGFYHHRPLPFTVSLGQVSYSQGGGEIAYAFRPPRQYPISYTHYQRQSPRCQNTRSYPVRTRRFVYHGPGLSGFLPTPFHPGSLSLFHYPHQKQFQFQASLFTPSGQNNRSPIQPNYCSERILCQKRLPGKAPTYPVL